MEWNKKKKEAIRKLLKTDPQGVQTGTNQSLKNINECEFNVKNISIIPVDEILKVLCSSQEGANLILVCYANVVKYFEKIGRSEVVQNTPPLLLVASSITTAAGIVKELRSDHEVTSNGNNQIVPYIAERAKMYGMSHEAYAKSVSYFENYIKPKIEAIKALPNLRVEQTFRATEQGRAWANARHQEIWSVNHHDDLKMAAVQWGAAGGVASGVIVGTAIFPIVGTAIGGIAGLIAGGVTGAGVAVSGATVSSATVEGAAFLGDVWNFFTGEN